MGEDFAITEQAYGICVQFVPGHEITPEMIICAMDRENELHAIIGRCDLWDFRGCIPSMEFGYDAMLKIIHHIESNYNDEWSTKTAILVDETIQFGLSRMFQILIDEFPTQVRIFQDEPEALLWVGEKKE